MLIRTLYIWVLITIATGCSSIERTISSVIDEQPIEGLCSVSGDEFDIGRLSFNIDLDPNWVYSLKPWWQAISFHYLKDGVASAINVDSYYGYVYWLEDAWHDPDLIKERIKERYAPRIEKLPYQGYFHKVERVEKYGWGCLREEEGWQAPTPFAEYNTSFNSGVEHRLTYVCFVPGQMHVRPIRMGISQSTGAGAVTLNLEAILDPVLKSMVLSPNQPPLPDNYNERKEAHEKNVKRIERLKRAGKYKEKKFFELPPKEEIERRKREYEKKQLEQNRQKGFEE